MAKILLVEDDILVADAVRDVLEDERHTIEHVLEGDEAADRLKLYDYDLVILDVSLPGQSGLDVCRNYRYAGGKVPILMLTGKGAFGERVEGLDAGSDDYLTKPFNTQELAARVRALLRRPTSVFQDKLTIGSITLDQKAGSVTRDGEEIHLLAKEQALLAFLMKHADQYFTVDDLLNKVWSSESDATEDAVRQTVMRLRKKIDKPGEESIISTSRFRGYVIRNSPS